MQTVRIAPADPDDRGVADLLFAAIGGDRTRLAAATRRYRSDGSTELVAATIGDELVGVAGYETGHDHLVLLHLATAGTHRRTGIGRLLVADIGSRHPTCRWSPKPTAPPWASMPPSDSRACLSARNTPVSHGSA